MDNLGAPAVEAAAGAALDAMKVEAEAIGAMMTKGYADILTIESSLEWMGILIEEET